MASSDNKIKTLLKLNELSRDTAVYLRHFMHVHNGTSAMVVIYDQEGAIVFVNVYKSKPYDTTATEQSFNQNHAEKFLIADVKEITTQTLSNYKKKTTKRAQKKATFRVCIFQSNSPCGPCSSDFIDFKKQIEQKLKLISGKIEFQVGRVWKFWRNKDGLRRLFGYQANGKSTGFTWTAFDWYQFYYAFYEWVSWRTKQQSTEKIRFASERDIIKHLNDVSASCAIDLISEEKLQVKHQIDSLSREWGRHNKCPGCGKRRDVVHCHTCYMDGHAADVCLGFRQDTPFDQINYSGGFRHDFQRASSLQSPPLLEVPRGSRFPAAVRDQRGILGASPGPMFLAALCDQRGILGAPHDPRFLAAFHDQEGILGAPRDPRSPAFRNVVPPSWTPF